MPLAWGHPTRLIAPNRPVDRSVWSDSLTWRTRIRIQARFCILSSRKWRSHEATQINAGSIPPFRFAPIGIDCYSLGYGRNQDR